MSDVIYLYGEEWLINNGSEDTYFIRLRREDRSQVVIPLPAELARQIRDMFVSVENMRHEKEIKRITNQDE